MNMFRVFGTKENYYITHTNEWVIDIEGHVCSLYTDPEADPDITMREDCIVEYFTGYKDRKGTPVYEGDVFKDGVYYYVVTRNEYNQFIVECYNEFKLIDTVPLNDLVDEEKNNHHICMSVYGSWLLLKDEIYDIKEDLR